MEKEVRRGGLVGPLILIGLGAILLLSNLGMVNWSIWRTLLPLWPLLLIAIGIDLLIGRRSFLGSLVALALILAVFIGGFLLFADTDEGELSLFGIHLQRGQPLTSEEISQPLGGVKRAQVIVQAAAAALHLDEAPESASLVEGQVRLRHGEQVWRDYQIEGDKGTFLLRMQRQSDVFIPGWSEERGGWDLGLNPDVPLQLQVGLAAGRADLDLTGLNVTDLEVNLAAGHAEVILPVEGHLQGRVSGAVGELVVIIPKGMEARIKANVALGKADVPQGYRREGSYYTSPGYAGAESSVDLELGLAIGKITVREGS